VTTIRAPLRPRSGGRGRRAWAELALPVLTVVSGLQLLRLLLATEVGVYRDRLGASLAGLALFAFAAAALVGLAAVLAMGGPAGQERLGAGRRPATGGLRGALAPLGLGVALLAAPALAWATAPDPVPAAPGAGPGRPVRVMSYNLHFGFDVRGWSDLEAVARAIEAAGAEVVGLQEVSRGWYVNGSTDMLGWLQRRLRMPYARFAGASDGIWGNAVLSRHPIVADRVVALPSEGIPLRRNALRVELDLGAGRRLRVVVTHLHHVQGPDGTRVRLAQLPRLLDEVAGRPPCSWATSTPSRARPRSPCCGRPA
jgi:endonuclease/exonuclease/phosphatase (EEP) superfamily protein YafD